MFSNNLFIMTMILITVITIILLLIIIIIIIIVHWGRRGWILIQPQGHR